MVRVQLNLLLNRLFGKRLDNLNDPFKVFAKFSNFHCFENMVDSSDFSFLGFEIYPIDILWRAAGSPLLRRTFLCISFATAKKQGCSAYVL